MVHGILTILNFWFQLVARRDVRANDPILRTYTHVVSGTKIHISCKTNTHHSAKVRITDRKRT
jgi:hypothetical protein